jgi:photosystem II stability/assembly factor-like uncharacterized protein
MTCFKWFVVAALVQFLNACGGGGGSTPPAAPSAVAPVILSQPQSVSTFEGMNATFSVQASGTAPLNYQWRRDGLAIAGADQSSYQFAATLADNGVQFSVIVSNSVGSVPSNAALLTVGAMPVVPTIVSGPVSPLADIGGSATLQVTAAGTPPLSYQWHRDGVVIAGATDSILTVSSVSWDYQGASFTVTVSNAANPAGVTSAPARLSLRADMRNLLCQPHSEWCWAYPRPSGLHYSGVAFAGADIVAVTQTGSIHRSDDNGASWRRVSQPQSAPLGAVAFATPTLGLAVGAEGTVLRTTDGGRNWNAMVLGDSAALNAVAFADAAVAVVVSFSGGAFRSTDGGATWAPIAMPGPLNLTGIAFNGNGVGLISRFGGGVLRSTDHGATWQSVPASPPGSGIAFASDTAAIVVGLLGMARSTDSGLSWTPLAVPGEFTAVATGNSNEGVATGFSGVVVRTADGGASWQVVAEAPSPFGSPLNAVAMRASGQVIAAGMAGRTLHSNDSGQTWNDIGPALRPTLHAVTFSDEKRVVAVGQSGLILVSNDGGRSWSPRLSPTSHTLLSVAFGSADLAIVVGEAGTLMRSVDGGQTWSTVPLSTNADLRSATFLSPTIGLIALDDPAGGALMRTTDGGQSWAALSVVGYGRSVTRLSETRAIAVGSSGAAVTADSGQTWTAIPAISGLASLPLATAFGDALRGLLVTLNEPLRYTSDGGATWSVSQIPSGPLIRNVAMKDSWALAVGHSTILSCNDGGASLRSSEAYLPPLNAAAISPSGVGIAVGENSSILIHRAPNQ